MAPQPEFKRPEPSIDATNFGVFDIQRRLYVCHMQGRRAFPCADFKDQARPNFFNQQAENRMRAAPAL
jgi:hypothetical protein